MTPRLARAIARYLAARFPPRRLGVAVLTTYVCMYLLCSQALGRLPFSAAAVTGGGVFVLLFLLMRLVDDLDDLEQDRDQGMALATRTGLSLGIAAVTCLLVLLCAWWPETLIEVTAAGALVIGTPLLIKRFITRNAVILAVCYEAAPAAVMLSGYVAWRAASGVSLPLPFVAGITAVFWSLYEFWKFSRMPDARGNYAYALNRRRQSALLVLLSVTAAAGDVVICVTGKLPEFLAFYGLLLLLAFAAWINGRYKSLGGDPAQYSPRELGFGLVGLSFVGTAEIGVLLESVFFSRI